MARSSRTCSPARPWRRIGEWVRRGRPRELCSRALAKGTRPLGFPSFLGVGGVDGRLRPSPCLDDTSCGADRPPTHFFVKKKFIPIGGAETATQKVPGVFCYARDFLCGMKRCAALKIPVRRRKVSRTQEGAFFFTKKAYCGNQTLCVAESRKSVQT